MYGVGAVRIGFYLQGFSKVLNLNRKRLERRTCKQCNSMLRTNSCILTSLALEAPVLVASVTAVSLLMLLQSIARGRSDTMATVGSLFALVFLYAATIMTVDFGSINGWYRGPSQCDVSLSPSGKAAWFTVFAIETIISTGIFALAVRRVYSTHCKRSMSNTPRFKDNKRTALMFWTFSGIVIAVCIACVETTIIRNEIYVSVFNRKEYGQMDCFQRRIWGQLWTLYGRGSSPISNPKSSRGSRLRLSLRKRKDQHTLQICPSIRVPLLRRRLYDDVGIRMTSVWGI
jgi:hypothetical protein